MIMSICDPLSNLPMRSLTVVTSFIGVARYKAMLLCSRDFIHFKITKDMFTNAFGVSQWYQWYTNIVQGFTNGTTGNTICTNGNANGTIGSTIGKPMLPLATNGTIGKITNCNWENPERSLMYSKIIQQLHVRDTGLYSSREDGYHFSYTGMMFPFISHIQTQHKLLTILTWGTRYYTFIFMLNMMNINDETFMCLSHKLVFMHNISMSIRLRAIHSSRG